MGRGRAGAGPRGFDLFDAAAGVGIVLCGAAALFFAFQLGTAAGVSGESLLADLRARAEKRVRMEREQMRPLLELMRQGRVEEARRAGEELVTRLDGNAQLHLFLAEGHRARGLPAPALREYRRAFELVKDFADRRSPSYCGDDLKAWLRETRGKLLPGGGAPRAEVQDAVRDLYFLERSLAGGCA